MNAVATTPSNRWTATFGWLLRREFWENRGGFLWAQLITSGIAVFLAALGAVIGVVQARRHLPDHAREIGDVAEFLRGMGAAGDGILMAGFSLTGIVVAFVVFFYALGSLYDDRRDRSALFWKSLPVSDAQTVLSKAAWALLLAPAISIAVGLLAGIVLWIIAGIALAASGVPHAGALFTQAHPFHVLGRMAATLPLGMLWSLPAVGWLMFCSAWVRSKPFLWAVLVPVLGCVIISIFGAMPGLDVPHGWIWYVAVYRGLMSVIPGTWVAGNLDEQLLNGQDIHDPGDVVRAVLEQTSNLELYASIDLWIGAAVGAAFIAAAIYLRRWRDEA